MFIDDLAVRAVPQELHFRDSAYSQRVEIRLLLPRKVPRYSDDCLAIDIDGKRLAKSRFHVVDVSARVLDIQIDSDALVKASVLSGSYGGGWFEVQVIHVAEDLEWDD